MKNSTTAQDMRAKRVGLELIVERMPAGCYQCGSRLSGSGPHQYFVAHESENIMLLTRLCSQCEIGQWGIVKAEGSDDDLRLD